MIAPSDQANCSGVPELDEPVPDAIAIARYGRVPQVARFRVLGSPIGRGDSVVVTTERGQELAQVLQILKPNPPTNGSVEGITGDVLRVAAEADVAIAAAQEQKAERSFPDWLTRAAGWKLQLELIDVELTLDEQLILYVLNDRGAETTRLALLAAAAGFGVIHVQPVSAEGIVQTGGGCGSCSSHGH